MALSQARQRAAARLADTRAYSKRAMTAAHLPRTIATGCSPNHWSGPREAEHASNAEAADPAAPDRENECHGSPSWEMP
jgi:hypothetical protein